jgi:hypothetical protein
MIILCLKLSGGFSSVKIKAKVLQEPHFYFCSLPSPFPAPAIGAIATLASLRKRNMPSLLLLQALVLAILSA